VDDFMDEDDVVHDFSAFYIAILLFGDDEGENGF
jgi:hypothetical protein